MTRIFLVAAVLVAITGCGATSKVAVADGTGPQPALPAPQTKLIPTINVVSAKGWAGDAKPVAARGTTVNAFAGGLSHPRWLHVLIWRVR